MENLNYKDILNRIGYFKNKRKISSYKIGQMLGHSENYFYRIESGEIKLTLEMFLEILEILEVSTAEFFSLDFINYKNNTELFNKFNSLTLEEKQSLLTLLKIK